MGETRLTVSAKLDATTVTRIDELVEHFSPFCEGRSAMTRILLEVAVAAIDAGTIPDTLEGLQALLRKHCKPQIVKGATR